MLSKKEEAELDKYLTNNPEDSERGLRIRKNAFGETIELYQDDLGASVYNTDTIYLLSIRTTLGAKEFMVLFESLQELLDEFENELESGGFSKYTDGKTFKKRMEELYSE